MSKEEEVVEAHPQGEVEIARNQPAEAVSSLDTFAGKVHVKWAPEATVSSLGLMPFFIEFLKTSGLFDQWVEDSILYPLVEQTTGLQELDEEGHQPQATHRGLWRPFHMHLARKGV